MLCPKCSSDNPGTLRVWQTLGIATEAPDRLIVCDAAFHCFSVPESRFDYSIPVDVAELKHRSDLELMHQLCEQKRTADGLARPNNWALIAGLPTLETFLEDRDTNPLGLQGPG